MSYTGGCACGQVRYEVTAEPMLSVKCQCRDCQRASGTGHGTGMAFLKAATRIAGELKFHDVRADSGNTTSRGFCPNCGSWVAARSSGFPDVVIFTAGSLDEPERFKPQAVIWGKSGQVWDDTGVAVPKFSVMPPMGSQ
jgi:hypothetical protein